MKELLILSYFASICLTGCGSPDHSNIEVVTLAKTTKSWNGASLPKYLDGTPEVTILKITIPPHTELPLHKHPK